MEEITLLYDSDEDSDTTTNMQGERHWSINDYEPFKFPIVSYWFDRLPTTVKKSISPESWRRLGIFLLYSVFVSSEWWVQFSPISKLLGSGGLIDFMCVVSPSDIERAFKVEDGWRSEQGSIRQILGLISETLDGEKSSSFRKVTLLNQFFEYSPPHQTRISWESRRSTRSRYHGSITHWKGSIAAWMRSN